MLVIGIVFFFFIGEKGTILEKDSITYLEYSKPSLRGVPPIYPFFLDICRCLFGPELFVERLYIVQGMFALIISVIFAKYISQFFELDGIYGVVVFACSLLPYSYTLKEYVATHAVLTESVAYPMFYLFFISICEIQKGITVKRVVFAILIATTMVLIRKQLVIFFVVLIYLLAYSLTDKHDKNEEEKTKRCIFFLSVVFWVVFFGMLSIFGLKSRSQLGDALLEKSMMVIDRSDEMYFDNEDDREIFRALYAAIESKRTRMEDIRSDSLKWDDVVKYNEANLRIAYEVIPASIKAQGQLSGVNDRMYEFMGKINKIGLRYHVKDLFVEFVLLIPSGLLSMVFIQKRNVYAWCLLYGALFYLLYIFLLIYLKINKEYNRRILGFSSLSLFVSVINLTFTNIALYGIQRYMVYSMGIMYISMFFMLKELYETVMRKKGA